MIDPEEELIIIYDDIALAPGKLRVQWPKEVPVDIMESRISLLHLGTQQFSRIRIGVGEKPAGWDLADYVLGRFPAEEEPTIRTALEQTVKACETILTDSVEAAMNQFNGK